jgi:hypothetical protein
MNYEENKAVQPYRTKLSVLFAAGGQKAVILRRGPKTHWRFIAWDLVSGGFTPGQWMKGVVRHCDLSPNGDKLLYWAAQHHASARFQDRTRVAHGIYDPLKVPPPPPKRPRRKIPAYLRSSQQGCGGQGVRPNTGTWTAISTPPYFSALAIWPSFGYWTGGGVFLSEQEILLTDDRVTPKENVAWPKAMKIRSAWDDKARQWQPAPRSAYCPPAQPGEELARALQRDGLQWLDWVVRRPGADMLFAGDGCIWRCKEWEKLPEDRYVDHAERIADFRDMQFELIAPPDTVLQW